MSDTGKIEVFTGYRFYYSFDVLLVQIFVALLESITKGLATRKASFLLIKTHFQYVPYRNLKPVKLSKTQRYFVMFFGFS